MKNRKIKLAVVGIGVMGLKHIDAISKTNKAKLKAVVDLKKNSIISLHLTLLYMQSINNFFTFLHKFILNA